ANGDPLIGLSPGEGFFGRTRLTEPIPDLRAIAFTLEYDPAFFNILRSIPATSNGENFLIIQPQTGLVDYASFDEDISTSFPVNFQTWQVTIRDDFPADFPTDQTLIRFRNIRGWLIDGTEIDLGATDVPVQIDGIVSTSEPVWAEGLRLFPNPVQGLLQIQATQAVEQVDIFDSQGRIVNNYQWSGTTIDVSSLAAGFYFARIHAQGGFATRKFVKQR
ncbi:MAG: T9SS type A sorting domain-containing protein, partial [Bacteroidota bacterium]